MNEVQQVVPETFILKALESNAGIETLKSLMELYDRWKADKSRSEFNLAMAEFQGAAKKIVRSSKVEYGNTKYSFAGLDEIMSVLKPDLTKSGLSVRWENEETGGMMKVTCVVTHVSGHSERCSMSGEPDVSGSKNKIQAKGSTLTYLKRYTMSMALGVVVDDDDGNGGKAPDKKITTEKKEKVPTEKQWNEILGRAKTGKVTLEMTQKHFALTDSQVDQFNESYLSEAEFNQGKK